MKKILDTSLMIIVVLGICGTAYAASTSLVNINWFEEPTSAVLLLSSLAGIATRRKERV